MTTKQKIGIIGNGFVGQATQILTKNDKTDLVVFDTDKKKCHPIGTSLQDLFGCDIVFIAVPTPMNLDKSCNTDILEQGVLLKLSQELKMWNLNHTTNQIQLNVVIRSTVPIGTTREQNQNLNNLNVYFMPEFLTEKNWRQDFHDNPEWISGIPNNTNNDNTRDDTFKNDITKLINNANISGDIVSNKINFVGSNESEMVKYAKNTFLAQKVSIFNELRDICQATDTDFNVVRKLVCSDPRITESHTFVPGPDGKFGYGGTCFPKDTNSFACQFRNLGLKPIMLEASIQRNENHDRRSRDWFANKGRAITDSGIDGILNYIVVGSSSIATQLCQNILKANNLVRVVQVTSRNKNVIPASETKRLVNIQMDISQRFDLCLTSVTKIIYLPDLDEQTDVLKRMAVDYCGTLNVLDFSKRFPSCETLVITQHENDTSKKLAHEYALKFGLDVKLVLVTSSNEDDLLSLIGYI